MRIFHRTLAETQMSDFISVTQDEMRRILDVNAKELLGISGDTALRRIRKNKTKDTADWMTVKMLALLLEE